MGRLWNIYTETYHIYHQTTNKFKMLFWGKQAIYIEGLAKYCDCP